VTVRGFTDQHILAPHSRIRSSPSPCTCCLLYRHKEGCPQEGPRQEEGHTQEEGCRYREEGLSMQLASCCCPLVGCCLLSSPGYTWDRAGVVWPLQQALVC